MGRAHHERNERESLATYFLGRKKKKGEVGKSLGAISRNLPFPGKGREKAAKRQATMSFREGPKKGNACCTIEGETPASGGVPGLWGKPSNGLYLEGGEKKERTNVSPFKRGFVLGGGSRYLFEEEEGRVITSRGKWRSHMKKS